MDKKDLLSVFEFLALALKTQTLIEEPIMVVETVQEEIKPEIQIDVVKENDLVEEPIVFHQNSAHIKQLIDKVNPIESSTRDEDKLTKFFKEQEKNLAIITNKIASELRDNTATMEQREEFKNFVRFNNSEAINDLRKKEIELNNLKQITPKKSVEDIVKEKDDKRIKSLENYLKQNTNIESNKKSVIIDENIIRENGMVRFKEEFKNGLGPVIKFGFDGRPIG